GARAASRRPPVLRVRAACRQPRRPRRSLRPDRRHAEPHRIADACARRPRRGAGRGDDATAGRAGATRRGTQRDRAPARAPRAGHAPALQRPRRRARRPPGRAIPAAARPPRRGSRDRPAGDGGRPSPPDPLGADHPRQPHAHRDRSRRTGGAAEASGRTARAHRDPPRRCRHRAHSAPGAPARRCGRPRGASPRHPVGSRGQGSRERSAARPGRLPSRGTAQPAPADPLRRPPRRAEGSAPPRRGGGADARPPRRGLPGRRRAAARAARGRGAPPRAGGSRLVPGLSAARVDPGADGDGRRARPAVRLRGAGIRAGRGDARRPADRGHRHGRDRRRGRRRRRAGAAARPAVAGGSARRPAERSGAPRATGGCRAGPVAAVPLGRPGRAGAARLPRRARVAAAL
ncbi:MAG: Glycosyl transferase, group 1, partial [uncultured Solirubrobacteraceae bacterium]